MPNERIIIVHRDLINSSDLFERQNERCAFSTKDYSSDEESAIFYCIFAGWDKESISEVKEKYNWSDDDITKLITIRDLIKGYQKKRDEFPEEETELENDQDFSGNIRNNLFIPEK